MNESCCQSKLNEQLVFSLDNTLSELESVVIEKHLMECQYCVREYELLHGWGRAVIRRALRLLGLSPGVVVVWEKEQHQPYP